MVRACQDGGANREQSIKYIDYHYETSEYVKKWNQVEKIYANIIKMKDCYYKAINVLKS